MVIRDYWQDARASRQLDEQWHGAVIFASNQHVVVNTSGSVSNQPVIADETTRRAFTHVSSSSSSAAPSSSSTWANTARREFGHGGKRADDQVSTSCQMSTSQSLPSPSSQTMSSSQTLTSPSPCSAQHQHAPDVLFHPDSNFVMFIIAATSGRASINCSSSFNAGAVGSHFRV